MMTAAMAGCFCFLFRLDDADGDGCGMWCKEQNDTAWLWYGERKENKKE
jgi:hypothetical protein